MSIMSTFLLFFRWTVCFPLYWLWKNAQNTYKSTFVLSELKARFRFSFKFHFFHQMLLIIISYCHGRLLLIQWKCKYFSFTVKQQGLLQMKFKVESKPQFFKERSKHLVPSGSARWTASSECCRAARTSSQGAWIPSPNLESCLG